MHQLASGVTVQVDLVTEALIREHLNKKRLNNTLSVYNSELPKGPEAISKRSVLQQLLGLEQAAQAEVAAAKARNRVCTCSSILELWVKQQLAQQSCQPASDQHCHKATDSDKAPGLAAAGDMPRRISGMQTSVIGVAMGLHGANSRFGMSGGAAGPAAAGPSQPSPLPGHSDLPVPGQLQQQHTTTLTLSQQQQPPSSRLVGSSQAVGGTESPVRQPLAAFSATPKALNQQQPHKHQLQPMLRPGSPGQLDQPSAAGLRAAAASNAAAVAPSSQRRCRAPLEQQFQHELVLEDLDDEGLGSNISTAFSSSGTSAHQIQAPAGPNRLFTNSSSSNVDSSLWGTAGGLGAADLQPLLPEQQRQLSTLLWGDANARPDAAWGQGLVFSTVKGLEWGLVQSAGGPCGVLATVQAHLVGTLMEQGLWGAEVASDVLLDALVHSLAIILWTARSGSNATVVVLPSSTAAPFARGLCDAAQVTRSAQMITAASMQQLESLIKAAMPQYCARKGWGLLLLLYALLLTRGCSVVMQDMDDSSTCLVDHHGYCSMELVNLMLTGAAVSNVFDGKRQLGAADSGLICSAADQDTQVLKGAAGQARVGLLTLFEWYRYVEVGQNLKCPKLPAWVICSESHFTTLAVDAVHWIKDANGSGSVLPDGLAVGTSSSIQPAAGAAVVLEFYDGMADAECSIKLSLLPATGCGWSSKLKDVADDRGTWQGRPIPPLECVIETKWPDVQVTWHGTEPIL